MRGGGGGGGGGARLFEGVGPIGEALIGRGR